MKQKKFPPRFFITDENERVVFYPLAYPGQGFYIDAPMLGRAVFLLRFVATLMIAALWLASFYDPALWAIVAHEAVMFVVAPILYVFFAAKIVSSLRPYAEDHATIPMAFYFLLFILLIKIMTICVAFFAWEQARTFVGLSLIYSFIYVAVLGFLMKKILRTKGCVF